MAQIRLLLDEDTQVLLAPSLRDAGYDVKHVLSTLDAPPAAGRAAQGRCSARTRRVV